MGEQRRWRFAAVLTGLLLVAAAPLMAKVDAGGAEAGSGISSPEVSGLAETGEKMQQPDEKASAVAPVSPTGDPLRGEALYVGTAPFEKGGAPCLGCHGVAGAGLGKAAGASYGPDLTTMYEGYGEEGVVAILESLPFPSMEALYAGRPLNLQEQLDLTAFLREVGGREPPQVTGSLLTEASAGVGVLFLVVGIFGRRRLKPVHDSVNESRGHEQ